MTYKQLRRECHNLLKSIPPSSQLLPSVAVPLHKKPSIFFGLEVKICHKLPRAIGRFHFWLSFVEFNMFFHVFTCFFQFRDAARRFLLQTSQSSFSAPHRRAAGVSLAAFWCIISAAWSTMFSTWQHLRGPFLPWLDDPLPWPQQQSIYEDLGK